MQAGAAARLEWKEAPVTRFGDFSGLQMFVWGLRLLDESLIYIVIYSNPRARGHGIHLLCILQILGVN